MTKTDETVNLPYLMSDDSPLVLLLLKVFFVINKGKLVGAISLGTATFIHSSLMSDAYEMPKSRNLS